MPSFVVRQKEGCRWDFVALGEVMLRLDPGECRIWTARQFAASEGGGEYNVVRGLKRCFGLDAAIHLLPGLSTVSLQEKTRNGLSNAARHTERLR